MTPTTGPTVFARAARRAELVREEARQLDPVKALITLLMVPFFVLGWLAAHGVRLAWAVASIAWTAGVQGWRAAHGEDSG